MAVPLILDQAVCHATDIVFIFFVNIVSNNMPVICTGPCGFILASFQIRAEVQAANRPAAIAVCSHSAGKQMLMTSKHGHQQLLESQSSPLVETQEID